MPAGAERFWRSSGPPSFLFPPCSWVTSTSTTAPAVMGKLTNIRLRNPGRGGMPTAPSAAYVSTLAVLWAAQLLITALVLYCLHVNHGFPLGYYGTAY